MDLLRVFSFSFLDASAGQISEACFSIVGGIFIFAAFFPQFYNIWRSKNTCGVNRLMYALHFTVAFCYFIATILLQITHTETALKISASSMVFLNLFVATGCLYVFLLKTQNLEDSKKLGMTEGEFYKMHILPKTEQSKNYA